ncbi:hypothetical protein LCGC14_2416620 [marine sediment metagenome]|uniref:LamG-like jellyroll fold domain-containing protein n=1 Tax=marine sediment metagenome TaxID=412755 RepID=A0A0F9BQY7_9ZZZZ
MALELIEAGKYFRHPLNDGLTGYWRMEEASWDGTPGEVIDSSGQDNHGSAKNGATTTASGKLGRGGNFIKASGQHVSIASHSISNASAVTLSAWVYPDDDTNPNTVLGGAGTFLFRVNGNNRKIAMFSSLSVAIVTSENAINLNEWSHIVFVWDGVNSWFHINGGDKEGIFANTGTLNFPATIFIGRQGEALAMRDFSGKIDEMPIYDRAISSDEVAVLYNSGAAMLIKPYALPLEAVDIRPELEVIAV